MSTYLTLEALQKATPVYNGFVTIANSDIPDYYKQVFPKQCACGGEIIITEPGHTQLQCCNPNCYLKMGYRLAYFISKLGYKGFGEQSALTLVSDCRKYFKYPTFLSVFLLSDTEINSCLTEHLSNLFCEIRDDIKTRAFHFPDAISALGIPNIGSRSPFFEVVKTPIVLLQYLLKDKTDDICEAAGIQAPMTRFQLSSFKLDILTLMKDVMPNIVATPDTEIYIAITGKVSIGNTAYTRQEFITLCEGIVDSSGQQLYKIVETKAETKLQYVIADTPSASEKYRLGEKLHCLISAEDFYNLLLSKVKKEVDGENESDGTI